MILTATSESTRIVEYEWTINGVIYPGKTQSIEVDVEEPDVVTVRGLNDCGNWSAPVTLKWGLEIEEMLVYAGVFILALLLFMRKIK